MSESRRHDRLTDGFNFLYVFIFLLIKQSLIVHKQFVEYPKELLPWNDKLS